MILFKKKLKEWHNYVVEGLINGLTHTHRDGRNNDIDWVRKRLALFESFSRCVMDFIWGNNYEDFSEKELKEVAREGYTAQNQREHEKKDNLNVNKTAQK